VGVNLFPAWRTLTGRRCMATRLLPSVRFADTRGGSRMRGCRPYGFVRVARGEAHVPTAISNSVHAPCCTCSRQHLAHNRKLAAAPRLVRTWGLSGRIVPVSPEHLLRPSLTQRSGLVADVSHRGSDTSRTWRAQLIRAAGEGLRTPAMTRLPRAPTAGVGKAPMDEIARGGRRRLAIAATDRSIVAHAQRSKKN